MTTKETEPEGSFKTRSVEDEEGALRERLRHIATQYSQSELARRTGIAQQNIARYLKDRRVPTIFCTKLVQNFGINPAWLIAGEGAPLIADASSATAETAGDLLALTKSMNSVAKLRLGSLAGKKHLEVHRELDQALRSYKNLRTRIQKQTENQYRNLLEDIWQAIQKHNQSGAQYLIEAASQISSICDIPELNMQFDALKGFYESLWGDRDEAIRLKRSSYLGALAMTGRLDGSTCRKAVMLAFDLFVAGKLKEARRIVAATLVLSEDDIEQGDALYGAYAYQGFLDVMAGDVEKGMGKVVRYFALLDQETQERNLFLYLTPRLYTGEISLKAAETLKDITSARAHDVLTFATMMEDPDNLSRICSRQIGNKAGQLADSHPTSAVASYVNRALKGDGLEPLNEFKTYADGVRVAHRVGGKTLYPYWRAVMSTQIARLCDKPKEALSHLKQADKLRRELPREIAPYLWIRVTDCNNALKLIASHTQSQQLKALREQATRFICGCVTKGFAPLASFVR